MKFNAATISIRRSTTNTKYENWNKLKRNSQLLHVQCSQIIPPQLHQLFW